MRYRSHVLARGLFIGVLASLFTLAALMWSNAQSAVATNKLIRDDGYTAAFNALAAANVAPQMVTGRVWDDANENGLLDAGELGMSEAIVTLWDESRNVALDTVTTSEDGQYTLLVPDEGSYRVRIVSPHEGFFTAKGKNAGTRFDSDVSPSGSSTGWSEVFALEAGIIMAVDAGFHRSVPRQIPAPTATRTPTPINIGNFVWDDLDKDGRQDVGEPGLSGITVQLWNSSKTSLIDSTTTNGSGNYTVVAPVPGNYRIRVLLPDPTLDQFSPKDQASGDDLLDSDINPDGTNFGFTDAFNIASNVISITTKDAGIIVYRVPTPTRTPTPINIGNFVWDDLDGDGRQDVGEPGLSGVTVQLWNNAMNDLIDSTTTNGSGIYTVVAPVPGSYRVRVVLPGGMDQFSPKDNVSAGDLADSDINPSGGTAGFTDTINIASNVISITSIDAGIIRFRTATPTRTPTPVNIGNFVWNDLDGDGAQDGGEPGIPNITVRLWDSTRTNIIDTDVTNSSGNYTLNAPDGPGDYYIEVVLPGGVTFSPKDTTADTLDSDINPSGPDAGFTDQFNIASNVISTTVWDVGLVGTPDTPTPTETKTPDLGPTATFDPFASPTPTDTPESLFPTNTLDPALEATETPTAFVPTPPATPRCDLRNFEEDDIVRASIRQEFDLFCRSLVENGVFIEFLGGQLTHMENVGIEALRELGMIHAVDIFSPSGQTYFTGGYVICLRGQGTLIWLDANNSPRRAEIIGSYPVPEYPGFTCVTLFTPGTLILVAQNPVA